MCGLAGFSGVKGQYAREALVMSLGWGIDERGGDAAGFVSLAHETHRLQFGRKVGTWMAARERFIRRAANAHTAMLHARFKTCGKGGEQEAHPFAIRREGKPVLWGAHNGIIYNAEESAKKHNRPYTVDSKELFELLADGDFDEIGKLHGYGVITWVEAKNPGMVFLVKLTGSGDIEVASTECGSVVWASTTKILKEGVRDAGMVQSREWKIETGKVYHIKPDGIFATPTRQDITVGSRWTSTFDGHSGMSSASYYDAAGHKHAAFDWQAWAERNRKVDRDYSTDEAKALAWMTAAHDANDSDDETDANSYFQRSYEREQEENQVAEWMREARRAEARDGARGDEWDSESDLQAALDGGREDDAGDELDAEEGIDYVRVTDYDDDTEDMAADLRAVRAMID